MNNGLRWPQYLSCWMTTFASFIGARILTSYRLLTRKSGAHLNPIPGSALILACHWCSRSGSDSALLAESGAALYNFPRKRKSVAMVISTPGCLEVLPTGDPRPSPPRHSICSPENPRTISLTPYSIITVRVGECLARITTPQSYPAPLQPSTRSVRRISIACRVVKPLVADVDARECS